MGVLFIENEIHPITGKHLKGAEFDTVSCCHCQAIIRVVIKGVDAAYETRHYCGHCDGSICNWCQGLVDRNGGKCTGPIAAKVERALKTGDKLDISGVHEYRM